MLLHRRAMAFAALLVTPTLFGQILVAQQAVPSHREQPSARDIVRLVREAVGYRNIHLIAPGVMITDARPDAQTTTTWLGTAGQYRLGNQTGFDGQFRWQMDARRGRPIPNSRRQHEKAAWPLWIRSHWWLNPDSDISVTFSADQS